MLRFLFSEVAGLQLCNCIEKGLLRWCFPVTFSKFLRTSIAKNIYERLIRFASPQNTIANSSGGFGLYKTLSEYNVSIFLSITRSSAVISKKCFFNISINIIIKILTLRAFEIFYFTFGKLGRYHVP